MPEAPLGTSPENGMTNTPEADETMPAGRELDCRVAEKVMGYAVQGDQIVPPNDAYVLLGIMGAMKFDIPHYSTDIADAWLVVEKMKASAFEVTIDDTDGDWWALFADLEYKHISSAYADTAPLAVCRAALKAMGA